MTVDYHKLNQIVGPTVADMPDMVSWWEKINSASGMQSWSSKNIFFILFKRNDQSSLHLYGTNKKIHLTLCSKAMLIFLP